LKSDLVEIQSWKQVEAQGLHMCIALLQQGCSQVSRGCTGGIRVSEGLGLHLGFPEQGLEVLQRVLTMGVSQWWVMS